MGSDRTHRAAEKVFFSRSLSSKAAMNLSYFEVLVFFVCLGDFVDGATNCNEALEESSACQERAMAAHDADYVEPSTELGKDWLEMEARRNCRMITCINELVAFCPDMLKPFTESYSKVIDKFEELAVGYEEDGDWDTEKCPGAVALKAKKDPELTDCVAEVDKFSACNDKGKERRNKWLDMLVDESLRLLMVVLSDLGSHDAIEEKVVEKVVEADCSTRSGVAKVPAVCLTVSL